ncbi:MAG: branched-chain amino acid ABC transporter permease [Acidobacteria bacterium]|nr:branched-chain amino acid ABC transporter permease [Acidobacteriota bacterium]
MPERSNVSKRSDPAGPAHRGQRPAAAPGRAPHRLGWALALVCLLALALLPGFTTPYQLRTYTQTLLLVLMAQGWNLVGGFMGYSAFGNVAFFGIGAYTTGLLMLSPWQVSFFTALAAGAILAAAFAAVIGLPILRLKGHYFAIATLGVAEATRQVADAWDSVTNGSTGINLPLNPNNAFFYWTALGLSVLGLALTWWLARSKVGYGWIAIREDEEAAAMLGIHTTALKVLAFALSALFAALAGSVTAYQNIHVTPTHFFKIDYTLQMIIAAIMGGSGTVFGPWLGGTVYHLSGTYLWGSFPELHPTFLGLILILFIVFLPRGLIQLLRATVEITAGRRRFAWADLWANLRSTRVS